MKTMAAILILALPCLADEIVMKDGRRIPWRSVADDGENYAVETRDGKKIKVKKVDVDHFNAPSDEPISAPLTGATVDPGKKPATAPPIDILLKGKVDAGWKYMGRMLVGTASFPNRSIVTFDHEPLGDDYDLTLTVERADDGKKDFDLGIVTAAGTCAYHFDAWDATKSCLALLGGQEGEYTGGQVFKKGKPRQIKAEVRKDGITLKLDGRDFWKGKVDWSIAGLHPAIKLSERGRLFLVAAGGSWNVSAFSVTPR